MWLMTLQRKQHYNHTCNINFEYILLTHQEPVLFFILVHLKLETNLFSSDFFEGDWRSK